MDDDLRKQLERGAADRDQERRDTRNLVVATIVGMTTGAVLFAAGMAFTLDASSAMTTAEAASFRSRTTGIANTLFIRSKNNAYRIPYLTIAIDPPDSLDPYTATAAMSLDGLILAGRMPRVLVEQVRRFIQLNREVLLDYWHCRIDTGELQQQLQKIEGAP